MSWLRGPGGKLKSHLLAWALGPIALVMMMDSYSLYQSTAATVAEAHDRLLKATAQQIGDLLRIERSGVSVHVPLALIEALEGAGGTRMFWRVIFDGRVDAGDTALPAPAPELLHRTTRLSFSYLEEVEGRPVRIAALQHPVETSQGQGTALILVGETLEARQATAAVLLRDMLSRQVLLMLVITAIMWVVVTSALRPLTALREELRSRLASDPQPLRSTGPEELQPVIDEMNHLIERQHELLHRQRRFVADASHQLRTPLTVLKTQLQTVLMDHAPAAQVLPEMLRTVDRAAHVANQLLNKARLEAASDIGETTPVRLDEVARDAALGLSPLIARNRLHFSLEAADPVVINGSPWMVGELVRNLLANAIRHSPPHSEIGIRLEQAGQLTRMIVWDSGPGIDDEMREWLFQPFAAAKGVVGAGLGLAICLDIVRSMQARIDLTNRCSAVDAVEGLDAIVAWTAPLPAGDGA